MDFKIHLKSALQRCLLVLCVITVLCRFWPSDRWMITAPFAYVPTLLTALLVLTLWIWARRYVVPCLILLLLLLAVFYLENRRLWSSSPPESGETIRVLHWNVWGVRKGVGEIVQVLNSQHPDVILLNEPKKSRREKNYPPYDQLLGGMWHSWTESFMAILSRHPLTPTGVLSGNGYEGLLARIGSDPPITVLLLDVSPQITSSRRKVFSEIRLNLSKLTPPPDLIAGDFNTPQLSFSLTQMREMGYTDSYSDAGSGISYTWPSFLPLTRIDFVLVKKGRNVSEHQIGFSSLSDHAWQRVDIYRPGFSNDR